MLSFTVAYRGQRGNRGPIEDGRASARVQAVPNSLQAGETAPGTPEPLPGESQHLGQSPERTQTSPAPERVPSEGSGQRESSNDTTSGKVSPVVPVSPFPIDDAPTLRYSVERIVEEYRQAMDALDGLTGDALRRASQRCLAIAERIDREFPGFDWLRLWREYIGKEKLGEVSGE